MINKIDKNIFCQTDGIKKNFDNTIKPNYKIMGHGFINKNEKQTNEEEKQKSG